MLEIAAAGRDIAEIMAKQGKVNEALQILREKVLPGFTQLGDVREIAITQRQIAEILFKLGDLDGAHELQVLRLETNRKLGRIDGVATALSDLALTELAQRKSETAFVRLLEAWPLFLGLQHVSGIASIGYVFGQLLAGAGQKEAALATLAHSAAAYRKLGADDEVALVDELIKRIVGET